MTLAIKAKLKDDEHRTFNFQQLPTSNVEVKRWVGAAGVAARMGSRERFARVRDMTT
jgi:hypothetical protein